MTQKVLLALLLTLVISSPGLPTQTAQAQDNPPLPALILAATEYRTPLRFVELQNTLKAYNGRITHTFPFQAIIARIPVGYVEQVAAQPAVAGVFTRPVELAAMDRYGSDARRWASVWNHLIKAPDSQLDPSRLDDDHPPDHNDALIAPDLPPVDPSDRAAAGSVTPGYYQTSTYMAGSVAVGLVLVQSDGTVDPSTETWSADEKQQVFDEIVAGLDWWAQLEPRANLSFVYDDHFSNPLPTGVEPITRPYSHQQYWIADAMGALGYSASSYFTRVRDYNNDLRAMYQTDWAFTIFVVDSSADVDNRFSGGFFAYAYLGGPFTVMTYGNNGYGPGNMEAVIAHEMGHIFNALDQYYSAYQPCTRRSGYLDVENQNSQYGSCALNVTSIMRGQTFPYALGALDPYAAGQVGWRDSDNDNILDPLDTDLPISIDNLSVAGDEVSVTGFTQIMPYPSPSQTSVTINRLSGVQFRFDQKAWQQATAIDGVFDGVTESYQFTATSLPPGLHTLEVAAVDIAGNLSDSYASQIVAVLDPIDGGLNTELNLPGPAAEVNQASIIRGVAYHMQDGLVMDVQYRINGGSWQAATAEDGQFNSNYEPFYLTLSSLEPGTYLVEAFAVDAEGKPEINLASQEIELLELPALYLPLVMGRE